MKSRRGNPADTQMQDTSPPILFAYPEAPDSSSGYCKVVQRDHEFIRRFFKNRVDLFYTRRKVEAGHVLKRRSKLDPRRLLQFVTSLSPSVCPDVGQLEAALPREVSSAAVFCGDTCMYPSLRKRFPDAWMAVRFHNVYATSVLRIIQHGMWMASPMVMWEMARYLRLEMEIFGDRKVIPVFLCREEAAFFRSLHPARRCFVKAVAPRRVTEPRLDPVRRLVWLGGLSGHKLVSMRCFLRDAWPLIRSRNPGLELDLHGMGTEQFKGYPGVNARGVWRGSGWPAGCDALFVNPDYVGGGVKIKLLDYIEAGIPFISTPEGAQGVRVPSMRGWMVLPMDGWPTAIQGMC